MKIRMPLEARQPRLLERHVVVGVEVVQAENVLAVRQKAFTQMITDEPGGSGH